MKKILFMIFFIITSTLIYSNENIVIERSSFVLELSVDENSYYTFTIPQSPYILDDFSVQIFPGETLFIEVDVVDDIVEKLTVVKEIINKNKTIIIEFNQITNKENARIHELMMLKIINPFKENLEYKADIYLTQYHRWVYTSTIPVRAGLTSYESWPDIILTIVLYDFVLK